MKIIEQSYPLWLTAVRLLGHFAYPNSEFSGPFGGKVYSEAGRWISNRSPPSSIGSIDESQVLSTSPNKSVHFAPLMLARILLK